LRIFVNSSGLVKSHILERATLALSFFGSLSLRKVWKTAWKRFRIIACVLHSRTVIILRFLKPCTDKTHFKGVLVSGHSLMKSTKVIELPNDGWSWNGKLVSDIGHRGFFN